MASGRTPADLANQLGLDADTVRRRLRESPPDLQKRLKSGTKRWLIPPETEPAVEDLLLQGELAGEEWLAIRMSGPDIGLPDAGGLLESLQAMVTLYAIVDRAVPSGKGNGRDEELRVDRLHYGSPFEIQFLVHGLADNQLTIATWLTVVLQAASIVQTHRISRKRDLPGAVYLPQPMPEDELLRRLGPGEEVESYHEQKSRLRLGPIRIDESEVRTVLRRRKK